MAFQNVIDALSSTIHRDTISNPMVEKISGPFRESLDLFQYQLTPRALKMLTENGIDATKFGPRTHPHPFHKSVELHMLHKVWPSYASSDSGVMFMKESKFKKISIQNNKKHLDLGLKDLWNYKFIGKDATRFKNFSTSKPTNKTLFMHDALMYFEPSQILDLFVQDVNLERLFASLVVPAESEFCDISFYPNIYKFRRCSGKSKLIYEPEGHSAASYRQPISAINWLKITKIIGPDFTLKISLLESWGPIHLLMIEKCATIGDEDSDSVTFKTPEAVCLPNPVGVNQDLRDRLVPTKVYNNAFSYVRSVRTLRETDPAGYVRTQMNKEEYDWVTAAAWDNLQNFILKTATSRPHITYSVFNSRISHMISRLAVHSEKLGWCASIISSLIGLWVTSFAANLSRSKIKSAAFLWRWLKKPARKWYELKVKPAPFFKLESEILWNDFLWSKSLRPLCLEYPKLFKRFQEKQPKKFWFWLKVAAFSIPLAVQAWSYLAGRYAPQQLDMIYQSYFHPKPWYLELKRKAIRISPTKFFPDEMPLHDGANKIDIDEDKFKPHPQSLLQMEPHHDELNNNVNSKFEVKGTNEAEDENDENDHSRSDNQTEQGSISDEDVDDQSSESSEDKWVQHPGFPLKDPDETSEMESNKDVPQQIIFKNDQGLTLKKIASLSCGVEKYVLTGYNIDLHAIQPQILRNRSCIFFAKDDMQYGHDSVRYFNFGWPEDVGQVADFLGHHFNDSFNSALINIYQDGSSLPWHADDEPCYDDKHCILTLNLQGEGFFNTSHVKGQNCNRELLIQDDLLVMPPGFQTTHKHSVQGTVNNRISLTFRHQLASFNQNPGAQSVQVPVEKPEEDSPDAKEKKKKKRSFNLKKKPKLVGARTNSNKTKQNKLSADDHGCFNSQPEQEEEEINEVTKPLLEDLSAMGPVLAFNQIHKANFLDNVASFLSRERNGGAQAPKMPANKCLLTAFSARSGRSEKELWGSLCRMLPNSLLDNSEIRRRGLNTEHLTVLCAAYDMKAVLHTERGIIEYGINTQDEKQKIHINYTEEKGNMVGHFFAGGRVLQKKPAQKCSKTGDLINATLMFNIDGILLPIKRVHDYKTDVKRAKNLISNMKNGFDGVMANVEPLYPSKARDQFLALDLIMDAAESREIKMIHIAGFAGCGKSFPVQELLKNPIFKAHKVAVPTVELRGEWKEAMQYKDNEKWRVSTWESSMLKNSRILVIDEIYKMPRGYLDLAVHADSTIQFAIVLGDPLQGSYHSTHPSSNNKELSSEIDHLAPYIDYYCLWSRRIPRNVAEFFDVPTTNKFPGIKLKKMVPPSDVPILCNAVVTAKLLADTGHSSTTIASSQGSTYDSAACIHLDRSSSLLSKELSNVALTRSRRGIIFSGDQKKLAKDANSNHVFSDFWAGKQNPVEKIFANTLQNYEILRKPLAARPKLFGAGSRRTKRRRELRKKNILGVQLKDSVAIHKTPKNQNVNPNVPLEVFINHSKVVSGDGFHNAPLIETDFLPETRRPLHQDIPSAICQDPRPMSVSYSQAPFTHVYPGEHFETLAALLNPAHDPEIKEIIYKDEVSNQFPLLNIKFEIGALPSSTLAAVHNSSSDPTLLPASIPKRLVFRESDNSYEITAKDEVLGSILFSSLCSAYRRDPNARVPFDENQFAECINANEYAQLSNKTKNFIMANAIRSDPDWRYTIVRIFSKTQHKVNENSLFGKWKACQTLALMHDAVILILGPVKKYQRIYDKIDRPDHIYVHAGHTPFEMSDWCKKNLTHSTHVSNDYTAFDQSQHGEAVVLERKKMERLCIPQELIDMHVWLKTNVETQFGPLTCMRLTGEPGTYDDNTDYNLAVLHSQYLVGETPCMVSGDDSMLNEEPPPNPIWPHIENLLHLRFKLEYSEYALFCGYYVGKEGACRSPLTLFAKLAIAHDDGSIRDKRLSYITEFAVGHSLGEEMWMLFPEDHVKYQAGNFDYFCRFCPREEKLLLELGEPDEEFLNTLFATANYISVPVFALLKRSVRKLYLGKRTIASFATDKEIEHSLKWLAELSQE